MVSDFFINLFSGEPKSKPENLHPNETGATGTINHAGYFDEEYLQKLKDIDGIERYDEMRRSDGQIKMLLTVVKNPILSASWGIDPVDDSEEEMEIAAFAEHVLFHDIGYSDGSKSKTFRQFMREALTMIEFGHSVFEIVHKLVYDHKRFGTYHGLSDLSWRSPKTIYEWHLQRNGALKSIRQITEGDFYLDVVIPAKHLLVITNELEGSNYQGISALRPIYGNHFRKNLYRKLQAVGIERGANGVPVGTIDSDMRNSTNFEQQWTAFKKMLRKFAANQQNYIALEKGFTVSELKLSHDPEKVQRVIDGENIEMTKSFLANFMELGLSNSGSYSLGSDLSDIFLSSIQTIADEIAECLNARVLKKLIKAKYGEREFYPKISVAGINDKAGKELAEVVKMLIDAGAIKPGDRLERYLHKRFRFPDIEREQEEEAEEEENKDPESPPPANDDEGDKATAEQNLSSFEPQPCLAFSVESSEIIDSKPPKKAIDNAAKSLDLFTKHNTRLSKTALTIAHKILDSEKFTYQDLESMAAYQRNAKFYRPELKNDDGSPTEKTLSYLAFGGYEGISWAIKTLKEIDQAEARAVLADSKKKTNAPKYIEKKSKRMASIMRTSLSDSAKEFRDLIAASLDLKAERGAVLSIKMPGRRDYEETLRDFMVDIADESQKDALDELNMRGAKLADIKDLPKKTRDRILAEIALLATTQYDEVEKISYFFLNQRIDTEADIEETIAELQRLHTAQFEKSVYDVAAVNAVSGAVNSARNDVFQAPEVIDEIESFVFTNPDPKSPICKHLTGRVFSVEEYRNSQYLPPLHHNCKSTLVAQTKGDSDNLPISKDGLNISAQGEDKEKIMKSKTF